MGSHVILPIKLLQHRIIWLDLLMLIVINNLFADRRIVNVKPVYSAVFSLSTVQSTVFYFLADLFK